jgi:hypothetical protein
MEVIRRGELRTAGLMKISRWIILQSVNYFACAPHHVIADKNIVFRVLFLDFRKKLSHSIEEDEKYCCWRPV